MSPILPLALTSHKPKHFRYPKEIKTVGDELRAARIDKGLTQSQVADLIGLNRKYIGEIELNHRCNTISSLHRIFLFLGYVPITLKIDNNSLRGKLFEYRIRNGLTYLQIATSVGLDKSTISRFERGRNTKRESTVIIQKFLESN